MIAAVRRTLGSVRLLQSAAAALGLVAMTCAVPATGLAKDTASVTPGLVGEAPAEGRFVKTDQGYMVPYTMELPGTEVSFDMVPIPGGKFTMGSPAAEKGRQANEGPQFEVIVEPFWMGKYEVTWDQYKQFMALYDAFKDFQTLRTTLSAGDSAKPDFIEQKKKLAAALKDFPTLKNRLARKFDKADAITAPTKLYEPSHTFEFGDEPTLPAVTMTQYAAKHYTKWLSAVTGYFHRLPSEAEWEYACRAGTNTAYHFGDDPAKLGEYAWFFDNNLETVHRVGQKKPNPWGLYDMHGNVAEWVLDQLADDGYQRHAGKSIPWRKAIVWPTQESQRVVRGGHWDADADELRSAARMGSDDEAWKGLDPNIPLSPWWYTSDPARGVGFRIIRPLKPPTADERRLAWIAGADDILDAVADRLQEGRGAEDVVDAKLPEAIRQLGELKKKLAQ